MNHWDSLCTFDEWNGESTSPIIYRAEDHFPRHTDPRGGMLDVARCLGGDEHRHPAGFLRVTTVTDDLGVAAVVLDRVQVITLAARLYEWLQAGGEDLDPKALNRATGEAQPTMVFP